MKSKSDPFALHSAIANAGLAMLIGFITYFMTPQPALIIGIAMTALFALLSLFHFWRYVRARWKL